MNKLIEHCVGWTIGAQSKYPIHLYVDSECLKTIDINNINIAYLIEPEEIIFPGFYSKIIENRNKFKYILTDKEEILNTCSNSILFEYGTSWIQKNPHLEKIHGISTIIGFKNLTSGHLLRHDIWKNRHLIHSPIFFYASHQGGPALENNTLIINEHNRNDLFKYEFQIVIENKKTNYWFTEKLCDCFVSRVIPIYYGANNIADYFDTRGMILVSDLSSVIEACNTINESTYTEMKIYIDENEKRVKEYFNLGDRLTKKLNKLFK